MSLVLRSASRPRPQRDTDSALCAAGAAVSVERTQWDLSAPASGVVVVAVQLNIQRLWGFCFCLFWGVFFRSCTEEMKCKFMVFRREWRAVASECVGLGRRFNQAQDALDCSKQEECRSCILNK